MNDNLTSVSCSNGLRISCDYIRFTIKDISVISDVLSALGFSLEQFTQLDRGSEGYRNQLIYKGYNIRVLYNGNEDMGIHFNISGSAVSEFLRVYASSISDDSEILNTSDGVYYVFRHLLSFIVQHGHFTRFDPAIDDIGNQYFSVDDIEQFYQSGNIVSKFRNHQFIVSDNLHVPTGQTIYFGSRTSDIMLRIYNKALERKKKHSAQCENWTRWEFELKKDKADRFAHMLLDGYSFQDAVLGLLRNYFRIIELDDTNKSRCSTLPLWDKFLNSISALSFSIVRHESTIDENKHWIINQVARTFAKTFLAEGGDLGYLYSVLEFGQSKLSANDLEQIDAYMKSHSLLDFTE